MSSTTVRQSIFLMLQALVAEGGEVADSTLPDEDRQEGRIKWAAGAWDGVVSHHVSGEDDGSADDDLLGLVRHAAKGGLFARRGYARLYERAKDSNLLGRIDPLLRRIRQSGGLDARRLHGVAMRLATESSDRGPVKLGIALLGLYPVDSHREVLLTLGRHDEFTLYAAVALGNGQEDPQDDLWQLARCVRGWGRIHLVERLSRTERADILNWILRDGFRNAVMNEYLAHLAATRGNLLGALSADPVDDELLYAAGDLLTALISGGPAAGIGDYADGAAVTQRYLDLVAQRGEDLRHLLVIGDIKGYLAGCDWAEKVRMTAECDQLIARPGWRPLAEQAIESADAEEFWQADRAFTILGISTLPTLLRQLREQPLDPWKWHSVVRQADDQTIHQVVDLAIEVLPLAEVATGPGDELGFGPQWQAHSCVDFVVQSLDRWPGLGWPLVAAALASPVIRNRNMAIGALTEWPRAQWPVDAERIVRRAIDAEPENDVKERMAALLKG